ncbi:MAG: glycosyltransferase [Akkermansia sp.]|nr:glycosyltransferase [Akkermansia sp.]
MLLLLPYIRNPDRNAFALRNILTDEIEKGYTQKRGALKLFAFLVNKNVFYKVCMNCSNSPALVSVVVPVYNAAKYLREALDSLVNQDYTNLEIICVNDGSTDNSFDILREYARRDARIKVLDGPNGGYGKAMNRGLDAATGEYLAIFEPDDIIPPGAYTTLVSLARKNDAQICKGCVRSFSGNGNDRRYYNQTRFSNCYIDTVITPRDDLKFYKEFMHTVTSVYRLDFLRKYNIRYNETPGASYQDNGMFMLSLSYADRVVCTNEVVYDYRQDNTASSMHLIGDKPFAFKREYAYIRMRLEETPEVWAKVRPIFLLIRLWNHMTTYKKLRESFKLEYLEDFRKELMTMEDIEPSFLTDYDKREMDTILRSPLIYLMRESGVGSSGAEVRADRTAMRRGPFFKSSPNKVSYCFFYIPIWTIRKKKGRKVYCLMGIPLFKGGKM